MRGELASDCVEGMGEQPPLAWSDDDILAATTPQRPEQRLSGKIDVLSSELYSGIAGGRRREKFPSAIRGSAISDNELVIVTRLGLHGVEGLLSRRSTIAAVPDNRKKRAIGPFKRQRSG
jgi:hypothetical protein